MGSKETNEEDQAAAFSWWWDSHNHAHQSQWLEATLSELNEKTKLILNIIEEGGDSFAKRAEMFYKRKPELINLLEDLYKSHRSLAEKYDQLKSELIQASHLRSFSSLDSLKVKTIQKCEKDVSRYMKDKLVLSDSCNEGLKVDRMDQESYGESTGKEIDGVECDGDMEEKEKKWDERISKLIDENAKQQAELIRRNKDKNEAIERLLSQVHRLIDENTALKKSHLASRNSHHTQQSQFSRSKSKGPSFIGRLTGCTGS